MRRTMAAAMALGALLLHGPAPAAERVARCNGLVATIEGTTGDDVLRGTSDDDVIRALAGHDFVRGYGGEDTICGDRGPDVLEGGFGADYIRGGRGGDALYGVVSADELLIESETDDKAGDLLIGGVGRRDGCVVGQEDWAECETVRGLDPGP
jgi:Ca2+-binding RTX toxin-like protein